MSQFIKQHVKIFVVLLVIIIAAAAGYYIYRNQSLKLLDQQLLNDFSNSIDELYDNDNGFKDQTALRDHILNWADERGLEYRTDKAGNIVFNMSAVERKKNVSASVVCVSYNYETARRNSRLLASAAAIAATSLNSGRKTVIFINDEQNNGKGYKYLSEKILRKKTKVIYMDYGASSYISNSSFGLTRSVITIPSATKKVTCDTAVRVHISGITPDEIGPGISKQPDPVAAFSALLTRLKSKSTTFQLADFNIGSDGDMYPVSLDATFVLNSYSISSFTSFINKSIRTWEKDYDNPNIEYTYEVLGEDEELPEKAYSSATVTRLANILYTVKTGTYKYESSDNIPEGREEADIYGINCITDIRDEEDTLAVYISTQAYNDDYMTGITDDNKAAAELFSCRYSISNAVSPFRNDKDSLFRTLTSTYSKLNSKELTSEMDNYFTPCSYLATKNSKADVIHIRLNEKRLAELTNTILVYIEKKGNFLSL